jgi:hypothetical protein
MERSTYSRVRPSLDQGKRSCSSPSKPALLIAVAVAIAPPHVRHGDITTLALCGALRQLADPAALRVFVQEAQVGLFKGGKKRLPVERLPGRWERAEGHPQDAGPVPTKAGGPDACGLPAAFLDPGANSLMVAGDLSQS